MMSSFYFLPLHSLCPNPFQYDKIIKILDINSLVIIFSYISFLLYYEKPFEALILRICMGFYFFFSQSEAMY